MCQRGYRDRADQIDLGEASSHIAIWAFTPCATPQQNIVEMIDFLKWCVERITKDASSKKIKWCSKFLIRGFDSCFRVAFLHTRIITYYLRLKFVVEVMPSILRRWFS